MHLSVNQKENKWKNVFTLIIKAIYVHVEKSKNTEKYM